MFNQFEHIHNSHQKIVEVARDLFMELGYRAVSTRRIAEECGITQPTLYHHFKNKKAIYVEVLKSELFTMQMALKRIIERCGDDLEECLFQVTYHILINKPSSMGQMFQDIAKELDMEHQKKIKDWWVEAYQEPIASIFEKGIKEGQVRNPAEFGSYPIPSAYLLLNLISSNHTEEQEDAAKQQARLYTNVLLYGLASPDQRKK
ncbi:TetR/AcrR family transcriptional regulator [Sporosarcina cyprini]|uniref:TetR/AcrR family transcriptional regulator n=1 Tax=Sporosarcina cyprini TaxID=2910523 RepID=UPI001EDF556A|nr:TetR/AcrR family transcriptional regulator [Sporosarcina cyprini]MCG3088957.1 TetR/AcrR family transcriptional regulator [Sporosarcina cyprini]